ncbi:MAG TPA: GMC family oxidoreductase N-terminal domain-containing protein [Solirubrobacterales bacterium]|jgi:choline dehydrogenase|nr:GMC family oxidoreductase N-terminal domain-containing protein [Solirubrobacterales bacterium]
MYDYVIVGAGSAGCVLAARLSEDPEVSVLLLEAGPPDVKENIHVPLGYLQLARTDVDWDYYSAPEPNCNGRRLPLPRGKVFGGSSSVNAMVYIRGNRADYDDWGADGWAWDDLFPYFLKAEDNERGASEWHGAGGPLAVSDQRSGNKITSAFVAAGVEAGLARNEDFNGAEQDGVGMYQVTQRGGLRASASVAYLHPAMERPNLTVMPYMLVERVLFEGKRAVGVEASQLGQAQELRAEREVILCGGTYNSPQLLMLSGVGPAEHLAMREIEALVDQPEVGANLSDHAASFAVWTTPEEESLLLALEPAALEEFTASQTGPFASNLAESGGFARVEAGAEAPDTQFHVAPVHIVDEGMGDPQAHGVWVSPCLLTPQSRGGVRLASKDPSAKPIVRNEFFSAPEDMPRMTAAVRLMEEICGQPAMRPYCAQPFTTPGGESEDDLRAHVAATTYPIYHPVGTCAIGSVVDAELRVEGLEALRVVDASVMPVVPRGNTNAPTIAIAERAADLIKGAVPLRAGADPASAVP